MLVIKKITTLLEAEIIWNTFSPHQNIYDEWEFRYEYYKYFNYPLYFYTAYNAARPVALLPLQLNTDEGYLEFFGGSFMEDNVIYSIDGDLSIKEKLLHTVDQPTRLSWMKDNFENFPCEIVDYKYELSLSGIKSIDDFLQKNFNSKRRNNLKNQISQLLNNNITVVKGTEDDLQFLIEKNKERFGLESTFYFPHRIEYFKDIIRKYKSEFTVIKIDGKTEAVGLSIHYKNMTVGLNSGTNTHFNGLGKYLILQKINSAIQAQSSLYDARAGDLGWKESFNLQKRPQYQLLINK